MCFGLAVGLRAWKKGGMTLGAPFWGLVALAVVTAAQLLPLSPGLLAWLAPKGAALVTYATEPLGGPAWRCLSLDPPGTALSLAMTIGLAGVAGATALLVRDGSRALLLLWTVEVGGMALALLALVQLLLGSKAVFWVYAPEVGGGFVAPFVNPNHAGGFYGALTFLHLGLVVQIREQRARWIGLGLTALPVFLVVSSASRGAIVATGLGAVLFLVLKWRDGAMTAQRLGYALATTVILGTVAVPSSSIIRREFGKGTKWEALDEEGKIEVWRDAVGVARDYPLTGIGRGAFRAVFPTYKRRSAGSSERTFTNPENVIVQYLVELGPVVSGLLFLLLIWLAVRWFRGTTLDPLHVTALVPVLLLLGQNTVDFNLEFPGTGYLVAALLGVLAGLRRGRTHQVASRARRGLGVAGLLALMALGAATLATAGRLGAAQDLRREGATLAARLERREPPRLVLRDIEAAIRRHPADFYLQYLAGSAALRIPGEQPLRFFNRALVLNPRSNLTEYQVGRALMRLGLDEQALGHMLAALQLKMPLSGTFARDLFRLLQVLWQAHPGERRSLREAMCGSGLLGPLRLVPGDCLLAAAFVERRRAEPMSRIAGIDPPAAFKLARWMVGARLTDQARVAFGRLQALFPKDDEPPAALVRLCRKLGDPARALYWARRWLQATQTSEAYVQVTELLREAGHGEEASQMASAGLVRHPRQVGLVALQAEILLDQGALSDARQVLLSRMLGERLEIRSEMRLLSIRVRLEHRAGNRLREERLRSRLRQLQSLVHSGYKGTSPR